MVFASAHRLPGPTCIGTILGLLCLICPSALRAESPPGVYFGTDIGLASFSVEDDNSGCCYYFPGYIDGDNAISRDLTFGHRVNKHLAAEFEYFDSSPEWEQPLVYESSTEPSGGAARRSRTSRSIRSSDRAPPQ
jgi:hypothetical protein